MIRYGEKLDISEVQQKAAHLVEAMPYLRRFAGRIVVVKIGGEVLQLENMLDNLALSLVLLRSAGLKVVVCHGGGPQVTEVCKQFGIDSRFSDGKRVTCEETREVLAMVMLGKVNRSLVAAINRHGPHAVGLSGLDSNLLSVSPESSELGYVGKVDLVRKELVDHLLSAGFIPVIAPLGIDQEGGFYNVNGDTAAGEIARALGAEKLVILTNVEGIYEDFSEKKRLISEIDATSVRRLSEQGVFSAGMLPKVDAILNALGGGVASAHMLDGRMHYSLLLEIFTQAGIGTMIFP